MKKKIFSIILAVALVASMMTVAMISVSANVDSDGRYVPSTEDTYRYYFYMPNNWESSYTQSTIAGVYWWGGTDACGALDGSGNSYSWPGYIAQYEGTYDEGSVYYVDCPDDVAQIIWNNYVNGGEYDSETGTYEISEEQYKAAKQTIDISGLDDVETYCNYDMYPDGLETFDNMIFVIDAEQISTSISGKDTCGGEWYYYYGNGQYGVYPTLEEAEAAGEVYDTAYYPPVDQDNMPTPDTADDDDTDDTQETTAAADEETTTAADEESTTVAATASSDASSSTSDTASTTTTDNGTVQTGDASMVFIILFSVVAAAGVAIFARKRIMG